MVILEKASNTRQRYKSSSVNIRFGQMPSDFENKSDTGVIMYIYFMEAAKRWMAS